MSKKLSFRKEFKHQIRLAVISAIGFTIAFAWRNAIFDSFQELISRLFKVAPSQLLTETYTSIAITLAGVLLIFITSKILRE